jgi:hypothetical protein
MSKYKKVKRLFSFNNLKILKSQKFGYEGVILHLAPFDLSGWNVCPLASKGCIKGCFKYKRIRTIKRSTKGTN